MMNKKLHVLFLAISIFMALKSKAAIDTSGAFITDWDLSKINSPQIQIDLTGTNVQYYWEKVGDSLNVNSGTGYTAVTSPTLTITFPDDTSTYRLYVKNIIYFSNTSIHPSEPALIAVESWSTIHWYSMADMFFNATNLTAIPASAPDLSGVTNMQEMFYFASSFNQPLDNWNVSNVTNMGSMFGHAASFNQPLDSWNVSKVSNMLTMFFNASSFNQPLDNWNVSNVSNMGEMFYNATSFNQQLNNWNVSKVTSMLYMFCNASSFNQPLNNWDVSKVTNMQNMFNNATSFNQPLDNWNLKSITNLNSMLSSSGLSCLNYGLTLKGWAEGANIPNGLSLGATGLTYASDAQIYRDTLTNIKNWSITDNGIGDCMLSTLSIELTNYTATVEPHKSVLLQWTTATENNNHYFQVEKSTDAINFSAVAKINGNGTTTTIHNYNWIDNNSETGNIYYRLVQYDLDGTRTELGIREVYLSSINAIQLYPNPAKDYINIVAPTTGKVEIYNIFGVLIKQVKVIQGNNHIDINALGAGIYIADIEGIKLKFEKM